MSVTAEAVARRLRAEARARDDEALRRAEGLLGRMGDAAALLRAAGAGRVWLFGSLAEGRPRPESDVDLAVEGLPGAAFFEALAALMTLFGTRVDLVRLEEAPDSLRERVLALGRPL